MRGAQRAARASALVLGILVAGCRREADALLAPGGAPATWRYVEDRWGGLAAGEPQVTETSLTLPLRLGLHETQHVDSAICVTGIAARTQRSRIVVRLNRGICGQGAAVPYPHRATLPRPAQGTYAVVYDDLLAGYPKIGEARIP